MAEKGTAVATAPLTFNSLLERMKPQLAAILPKHLTPERMLALARLAATKTPKLKDCTPLSLVDAIAHASRLGLEIGSHAHLLPFKNGKTGQFEAVMIPDYRGLIHLARSSGQVRHVDARLVFKGDEFDYQLGSDPWIKHKPKLGANRDDANLLYVYAIGHLSTGERVFDEPMTKAEVDAVRKRSRASENGPWVTDYQAMAKKTAVKRLAKFLPQTPELVAAIELDNRAETGEVGIVSDLIDTSESVNQQVAQQTGAKMADLKDRMKEAQGGKKEREPGEEDDV